MGLLTQFAKLAGESMRISHTAKKARRIDPQTKQKLDNLVAKAKSGNVDAMFRLAFFYYDGQYVGYDPERACYWWTEAAKRGHIGSQYNLGLLYMGNISCFLYDEDKAGYWLSIAANNGDRQAIALLNNKFKYTRRGKWIIR